MNKIGLISDIHGNFEALKSVLAKLDLMGITSIYCLGDVVGYYSQINECCDELRLRNVQSLMGNHDWYLAGGGICARSQSVNDCLEYQRKTISQENINWLKEFSLYREVMGIKMVHGGWANPIDEYLMPNEEYFSKLEGSLFASGHTHVQGVYHFGSKTYCNPGSVGQPRDRDPRASFAVFDGHFSLHRVDYDPTLVYRKMNEAGFNDYYYGCLATGSPKLCKLPNS
jgi:putative phosphoesterase